MEIYSASSHTNRLDIYRFLLREIHEQTGITFFDGSLVMDNWTIKPAYALNVAFDSAASVMTLTLVQIVDEIMSDAP